MTPRSLLFRLLALLMLTLGAAPRAGAQLNTDRTLQVGRNALYFDDYALAIRYFNQVIDAKPYLADPYLLRAIAKYNLEDYVGARADAQKARSINPFLPGAWEVGGVASQCLGNSADAIADYSQALTLLPHNRQLLFNKALAQEEAGLYEAADSTYGELLEFYPRFDSGYVGRAQLELSRGDTLSARGALDRALEINANSVGALSLRAALTSKSDPTAALADMEQAVKLQPDRPYLRINRAVARYNANDLNGALDDFDYVLELEPMNEAALFNRAMLRMELRDNDRALADLNLLLSLNPGDLRSRYNRAIVLADKRMFDEALADADAVVAAHPQMYAAHALRAHVNHEAGREAAAQADYRRASQIAHRGLTDGPGAEIETAAQTDEEATRNRFAALQTVDDDPDGAESERSFNTAGIKGRVRDIDADIGLRPIYQLSYYTATGDGVYDKEIEDLNAARVLPFVVFLTNDLPSMTREAEAARHSESIARLSALIASGRGGAIDLFARSMDYMTLKDYERALADLNAVIAARPDFAPAWLMRAAVRYRLREAGAGRVLTDADATTLNAEAALALDQIMGDLDRALELNPRMAVAHYNRGVFLMRLGADADAIDAFSRAIALNPDLGPAYYNRGYAEFARGERDAAAADLSRAGQLGVSAAYRLLKQLK